MKLASINSETRVTTPQELSHVDRNAMFSVMQSHYEHVDRDAFESDLSEKQWVITTAIPGEGIVGFTTLDLWTCNLDGRILQALYSGDTAFIPEMWGSNKWVRTWCRHATCVTSELDGPVYWLLLTATHRTYEFLPAFFREFYPAEGRDTPPVVLRRMEAFLRPRFPDEFDLERGIVKLRRKRPVKQERLSNARQGLDSDIARYFCHRNPGYLDSDFLVCMTELSEHNYTRVGRRLFLGPEAETQDGKPIRHEQ